MAPPAASYVYFMRPVGAEGPVKIGCSGKPAKRLEAYMNWSPWPLEVVATVPGSFHLEWAFHAKFAHLHTHHEWFREDPELTATIDAIRAGSFDLSSLPPAKRRKSEAQLRAWHRLDREAA